MVANKFFQNPQMIIYLNVNMAQPIPIFFPPKMRNWYLRNDKKRAKNILTGDVKMRSWVQVDPACVFNC